MAGFVTRACVEASADLTPAAAMPLSMNGEGLLPRQVGAKSAFENCYDNDQSRTSPLPSSLPISCATS